MNERRVISTADLAGEDVDRGEEPIDEGATTEQDRLEPLLAGDDGRGFRERWDELQAEFVDDPQRVVEKADGLVAELMQRLAQTFAVEREALEAQWSRGDEVSTEDLRLALRRYRSFFERLLAT